MVTVLTIQAWVVTTISMIVDINVIGLVMLNFQVYPAQIVALLPPCTGGQAVLTPGTSS